MRILCLDGGSSSLKYATYDAADASSELERLSAGTLPAGSGVPEEIGTAFDAIGHRLVFGGALYVGPTRADATVLRNLEGLVAVTPLHLRPELDLVYASMQRFPNALQVLCFDTAFHRASPAIAKRYPLPNDVDPFIERYGFHGLSYEFIASQLPRDAGRTIVAHLGSGASLCAMRDGIPLDTTMGFTALGGLMMGTRPGDLDPGVILRLLADGYDLERLTDLLYHRSGLLGVSETTADMKTLIERSADDARAREAIELFIYQLTKHIGAMAAVLGGLDTLVFTGGIGEHAPSIRSRVCASLGYLGEVNVTVIPTDENLMIARHTLALAAREGIVKSAS